MSDKDERIDELEQQITELRRQHRETAIDRPRPGENAYKRVDDGGDDETAPDPDCYQIAYAGGDLPADKVGSDLPRDDGEVDYQALGMVGPKHCSDTDDGENAGET
jgi:hypothetical protein